MLAVFDNPSPVNVSEAHGKKIQFEEGRAKLSQRKVTRSGRQSREDVVAAEPSIGLWENLCLGNKTGSFR